MRFQSVIIQSASVGSGPPWTSSSAFYKPVWAHKVWRNFVSMLVMFMCIYSYVAHVHSSFLRPFNPALRVCLLCVANSLTLYVRFLLGGRSYKKSTAKSARRQCMKRDHNTMPTLLAKAGAYVFHRYCSILFLAPDAIDLNSSKKITPGRGLLCQIGTKESQTSV